MTIKTAFVTGATVRDVAKVMITAAEKGKRGDQYLAAGSLATMTDIAQEVEKASGVKAPTVMMPSWFALSIANLSEKWSGLTGSKNPMPPAGIRTLLEKAQLSSAKAEQELGATFRPLGETIKDTVAWYQSHSIFNRPKSLWWAVFRLRSTTSPPLYIKISQAASTSTPAKFALPDKDHCLDSTSKTFLK